MSEIDRVPNSIPTRASRRQHLEQTSDKRIPVREHIFIKHFISFIDYMTHAYRWKESIGYLKGFKKMRSLTGILLSEICSRCCVLVALVEIEFGTL